MWCCGACFVLQKAQQQRHAFDIAARVDQLIVDRGPGERSHVDQAIGEFHGIHLEEHAQGVRLEHDACGRERFSESGMDGFSQRSKDEAHRQRTPTNLVAQRPWWHR